MELAIRLILSRCRAPGSRRLDLFGNRVRRSACRRTETPASRLAGSAGGVRDRTGRQDAAAPRSRLGSDAVVAKDGPYLRSSGINGTTLCQVALTSRATSVPFTAVLTGPERTTTDNAEAASTWAVGYLRRSRSCPIRLWEQGVACSTVSRVIEVTVHDARVGRDPARLTPEGYGEILQTFQSDHPVDVGDLLTLDDGTQVRVIGLTESLAPGSWKQAVHVGDVL
jgi:hypothetical protein